MKFLVTFAFVAALYFGTESTTYPNHLTLKENVFDVHWYVNITEDRFYFKVVANNTGWVGLAFTTNEGGEDMKNYDIALGGVRNGNETYLKDYWSTSEVKPILDSSQDLMLSSATESNGKTTIEFNRKADTGDAADTPLKMNNSIFLAWAIGREDATDDNTFNQHPDKLQGGRGHTKEGYNMYTSKVIQSTIPPTTQAGSAIVPSIVALFLIQLVMQLIN